MVGDLSVKELALIMGCSAATVRREIERGSIKAYRIGGGPIRITTDAVDAYRSRALSKRKKNGPNPPKRKRVNL